MHPVIKRFIEKNADKQNDDDASLEASLEKPTLYWAVLYEGDFITGENLKISDIGNTQVYVGKANKGIKGRWISDSDNHCEMMKSCLNNICAMTNYDPLRMKGIQLT